MQGNPMDIFDEMDEMFDRLFNRMEREFMYGSPSGFRYSVRSGPDDGEARMEELVPAQRAGFQPSADVQHVGSEVKVVADLPGITADSLRLGVRNRTLIIDAGDADRHFHTTAELPPVDNASLQYTLKNGVLEVTFRALTGNAAPDGAAGN